jgi:hypothetical protein
LGSLRVSSAPGLSFFESCRWGSGFPTAHRNREFIVLPRSTDAVRTFSAATFFSPTVFQRRRVRFSVGSPRVCPCAAAALRVVFVCTGSAPPGCVHVVLSSPRHTVGRAVSSASSLQSSLIRGSITEAEPVFVLGCSRLDLWFSSTRAERC